MKIVYNPFVVENSYEKVVVNSLFALLLQHFDGGIFAHKSGVFQPIR